MTFSDYFIDIGLIALVLLQVRGRRLTTRALLLPIALVAWAAASYLQGIPTAGNDLVLVAVGAGAGTALGIGTGLATTVRRSPGGAPFARAGLVAALLWVLGVGTRFAFQFYATHGGGRAIVQFSAAHGITTTQAWVAALILMAVGEVLGRTAILAARTWRLQAWRNPAGNSMITT